VLQRLRGVGPERQEIPADEKTPGANPEPEARREAGEEDRGLEEALQ
jgi:hypothetical protein